MAGSYAYSRVEIGSDSSTRWAGVMATRKSVTKTSVGAREPRAAIRDIAALAGVSVATVSRVLNGRSDVSAATRATVLRHIGEVGYVSNRSARAGGRADRVDRADRSPCARRVLRGHRRGRRRGS